MASNIVWTSEMVQGVLDKMRFGEPCNTSCFYENDPELRAGNIIFNTTVEEVDEFIKCSENIIHFVQTYCRFLTDRGRRVVYLREYQKRILSAMAAEHYNEIIDNVVLDNRNIILMQSRQSGKCTLNSTVTIRNKNTKKIENIKLESLYFRFNKNNIFDYIKYPLYKLLKYLE